MEIVQEASTALSMYTMRKLMKAVQQPCEKTGAAKRQFGRFFSVILYLSRARTGRQNPPDAPPPPDCPPPPET